MRTQIRRLLENPYFNMFKNYHNNIIINTNGRLSAPFDTVTNFIAIKYWIDADYYIC